MDINNFLSNFCLNCTAWTRSNALCILHLIAMGLKMKNLRLTSGVGLINSEVTVYGLVQPGMAKAEQAMLMVAW